MDKLYDSLAEVGVAYGPTFQGISNCKASTACSQADLLVPDVANRWWSRGCCWSCSGCDLECAKDRLSPTKGGNSPGVNRAQELKATAEFDHR